MGRLPALFFQLALFFFVLGVVVWMVHKYSGLGALPGDISIKRKNFSFHFPIVSCLVASAVLSVLYYIVKKFL